MDLYTPCPSPNVIVPRQSLETYSPVFPSLLYCNRCLLALADALKYSVYKAHSFVICERLVPNQHPVHQRCVDHVQDQLAIPTWINLAACDPSLPDLSNGCPPRLKEEFPITFCEGCVCLALG